MNLLKQNISSINQVHVNSESITKRTKMSSE